MATVQSKITEIQKEQNTLQLIRMALSSVTIESIRIVTDNSFNYDTTRINAIKDFLEAEEAEVEANISDLLDDSCSGV